MEPELFFIFRAKMVAKNIVPGSPGDPTLSCSAVWCLFLKKHANILIPIVTL